MGRLRIYTVTVARPGEPPHTTVRTKQHYRRGEVAPLGGTFEILKGGFCGSATLNFSRPFFFEAGDRVRVYLPGDPPDHPTYLGEASDEPWEAGEGAVTCIPLSTNVARSAWWGKVEGPVRAFLAGVIGRCELAPDISVGDIPDVPIVLRHNTPFELLGDTIQQTLPNLPGASWGVDSRGRIGVHLPGDEVTHRFTEFEAEMPPGRSDGQANAVRFPYILPNGDQGTYNHRLSDEIIARQGARWFQTQAPSTVALPSIQPLLGQSAEVATHVQLGTTGVDLVKVEPVFDLAWEGVLAEPAPPLEVGTAYRPRTPEESEIVIENLSQVWVTPDGARRGIVPHVAVLRNYTTPVEIAWTVYDQGSEGQAIEEHGWQRVTLYYGDGFNPASVRPDYQEGTPIRLPSAAQGNIANDVLITYRLRIAPSAFQNGATPPGLELTNAAILQDGGWSHPDPRLPAPPFVRVPGRVGGKAVQFRDRWWPYSGRTSQGSTYDGPVLEMGAVLREANVPSVSGVSVALPGELELQSGSAVEAKAGPGAGATARAGDTRLTALTDPAPPEGTLRWGYTGPSVRAARLTFEGDVATLGRLSVEVADTAGLIAYGEGLLHDKVGLVRAWSATYDDLAAVPAHGLGRFYHPVLGDVDLAVQRLVYDLNDWSVQVECGTPQAADDEDAIAERFERMELQIRKAGGP